jgi:hypothetical protein
MKNQLVRYYLVQAGRSSPTGGIGPVYSVQTFLQRSFLSNLFRLVRPVLWSLVKAVGKESLRTGNKILSDITDTDRKPRDIIASHVGDSAQNLIQKLRGRGRKRSAPLRRLKTKKPKLIKKGHLFVNPITCRPTMVNVVCASSEFDVFADRTVQTSTVRAVERAQNPTTGVDQRDIEFKVPGGVEDYIDPDMQIYVKG